MVQLRNERTVGRGRSAKASAHVEFCFHLGQFSQHDIDDLLCRTRKRLLFACGYRHYVCGGLLPKVRNRFLLQQQVCCLIKIDPVERGAFHGIEHSRIKATISTVLSVSICSL